MPTERRCSGGVSANALRTVALAVACAAPIAATADPAARGPAWIVAGGDAGRGAASIASFGCTACHTIPGIRGANANIGPSLARVGDRTYIAGVLRNTPAELVRWIRSPQSVVPGNAMPDMGISEAQARDIAAYLYTLR